MAESNNIKLTILCNMGHYYCNNLFVTSNVYMWVPKLASQNKK